MKKGRVIAWVVWALYICAVLVLLFGKFSSSPDIPKDVLGISMDKLVHFLIFSPSVVLTYLTFYRRDMSEKKVAWLLVFAFSAAMAVAAGSEIAQYFLPWRQGEPLDLAADSVGAVLSTLVAVLVHNKTRSR
ncbi:MAG: VanZ family protein [Bacteroidales bacterium]|nr:VanZ family protein [Bacteroidales bacterium]